MEGKSGFFHVYDEQKKPHRIELIDLPGIYSLDPLSEDEVQAVDPIRYYASGPERDKILVLFVGDTNNPVRSLHLFCVARFEAFAWPSLWNMAYMARAKASSRIWTASVKNSGPCPSPCLTAAAAKRHYRIRELVKSFGQILPNRNRPCLDEAYVRQAGDKQREWFRMTDTAPNGTPNPCDAVLMHPRWGPLVFLAVMFVIFQSLFSFSAYPMKWIERGMASLAHVVENGLPPKRVYAVGGRGHFARHDGYFGVCSANRLPCSFYFVDGGKRLACPWSPSLADNLMRRFPGMNGKALIPLLRAALPVRCRPLCRPVPFLIRANGSSPILCDPVPSFTCSARLPVRYAYCRIVVPTKAYRFLHSCSAARRYWCWQQAWCCGLQHSRQPFYLSGILATVLPWRFSAGICICGKKNAARSLYLKLPDHSPAHRQIACARYGQGNGSPWNAGKSS